jgi:hypothetical protein
MVLEEFPNESIEMVGKYFGGVGLNVIVREDFVQGHG